jgi:hypothetical protein
MTFLPGAQLREILTKAKSKKLILVLKKKNDFGECGNAISV